MIYSALAPFYDAIMWHVDYQQWAQLLNSVIANHISSPRVSIIEIGGGTGTLGKQLSDKQYNYTGSDLSFCMSQIARTKNLPFICADALALPFKQHYDLALFLYDGINYLKSLKQYRSLLFSVASVIKPNGYFLFDITTKTNSLRYFTDFCSCDDFNGSTIVRKSYYLDKKHTQCNEFQIFTPQKNGSPLFKKATEYHQQKIFSPEHIESVIEATPFSIVGIWDGFSMMRYHKHSERIHFLLKKTDS